MIHKVVEVFIACYSDADEFFVGAVSYFVVMLVECGEYIIPFRYVLFISKPSKVMAMYDY